MKVILLRDIPRVGRKYDVANVASGYARNFLIPREMAVFATAGTEQRYETLKHQAEEERRLRGELLAKNIEDLEGTTITISEKATEQGHLFAGLHAEEIIPAIKEQTHLDVNVEHINLKKPIKELGEYKMAVSAGDKSATFTLSVERAEEK